MALFLISSDHECFREPQSSQAATYLANKAKFNRLRRKSRLDFDTLYQLFSADLTSSEIAKRAALSRPRVNLIYKQYFSELFGMSDRERRERREDRLRQTKANNLARVIAADRVLTAVFKSAEKAKRRIEPIIYRRGLNLSRRYRHRAVLVDRKDIEPVHHVCNARQFYPGGIHYGVTTLYRNRLGIQSNGSFSSSMFVPIPVASFAARAPSS